MRTYTSVKKKELCKYVHINQYTIQKTYPTRILFKFIYLFVMDFLLK